MAAQYAKILQPKPYHEAGTFNHAEPEPALLERAAKVLEKLPADQRSRFQEQVGKYSTWESLPDDLKQQIMSLE